MSLSKKPSGMPPMDIPQVTRPLPQYSESIKEAAALRNTPSVGPEFLTRWLLRLVSAHLNLVKVLRVSTHNIYFTTSYILALLGLFSYFRFYYRDQVRSYGFSDQAPGVAEALQTQNVATFKAFTLPTVLNTTERLFPSATPIPTPPTSLARLSITPFVDRVDLYPESLLIQFTPVWADYMGRHFYLTYPLSTEGRRLPESSFDPNRTYLMVGATQTSFSPIARFGFGTTRPQPDFWRYDPWASVRGLIEIQDEFPTQLESASTRHELVPNVVGNRASLDHSSYYTPPVLAPVNLWADLPIPAGPPRWVRVYNPDVKAAFAFTSPVLSSESTDPRTAMFTPAAVSGMGSIDTQLQALRNEFFQMSVSPAPGTPLTVVTADLDTPQSDRSPGLPALLSDRPQPGRRRLWSRLFRSKHGSARRLRTRGLGTVCPDIIPTVKVLRRVSRGPRPVTPPPVPEFDAMLQEQGVADTQRNRWSFRTWVSDVSTQSRAVLLQYQRLFFSSAGYQANAKPIVKKPQEEETPLERVARYEARARVLAERQQKLNSNAKFQLYRKASRKYRKARHVYVSERDGYSRTMARTRRRYGAAFRRYQDARLFWTQTLPHLIYTDLRISDGPVIGFIADSTQQDVHAWRHALAFMDRVQGRVPETLTSTDLSPARIRHFIRFGLWPTRRSAVFNVTRSSAPTGRQTPFIPFNAVTVPYPTSLIAALQQLEADGGYAAFYDVLASFKLSAGSAHARPDEFNAHVAPGAQHFQPLRAWFEGVVSGTISPTTPFEKPIGNEYHWALTMHRVISSPEGVQTLRRYLQSLPGTSRPVMTSANSIECPASQFVIEKVQREVQAYLDAVQAALSTRLLLNTVEAAQALDDATTSATLGYRYARALSDMHSFISCVQHTETRVQHRLALGARRQVTQSMSTLLSPAYPAMYGFMFPDATSTGLHDAWVNAAQRYHLTWKTPWQVFTTFFQRRPLEIPVPAGYRFFMEHVFSTTSTAASTTVPFNVPPYKFERQMAYYPFYKDLQALYGDLDVSFLPEKPVPKALYASFNLSEQGFNEPYLVQPKYDAAIRIPRALRRDPITGDVVVNHRNRARITRFVEYLLSSANWIKDRPVNFRGLSARLPGEPMHTGLDQAQASLASMGSEPEFSMDGDFVDVDVQSKAARAHEFPLQLHGYSRDAFFCTNFETVRSTEKAFFTQQYELYQAQMVGTPGLALPTRSWVLWFTWSRECPQLATKTRLYTPRLSMDEWHTLFSTCLQTAKESTDPEFILDLPVLAFHGMGAARLRGRAATMTTPTSRSALLTQMLMAITERNYGAYDLLGYDNPAGTVLAHAQAHAHAAHYADGHGPTTHDILTRPGLFQTHAPQPFRLVSHMAVPTHEAQADPMGAPTLLEGSSWRRPSHGRGRWVAAEMYMRDLLSGVSRAINTTRPWDPQARPAALPKLTLFHDTREPITPYWWLALYQFVFYAAAFQILRFIVFLNWVELKPLILTTFGSRRLRKLFLQLGLADQFTYRVVHDHGHTFDMSAGALNPKLFIEACESVVHLRNQCRPGTSMPKGLLLTGIPGTGKTYMVQMIAGEARVPVVTQTAAELFNRKNNTGLKISQTMTPAEQLRVAFVRARTLAPSILFIDEIDALGQARASVVKGGFEGEPDPRTDLYGYLRVKRTPAHDPLVPRISLKERTLRQIAAKTTLEQVRKPQYFALTADPYPGERPLPTDRLFAYKDALIKRENQQVGALTEFLVQMDGLRPLDGVLVIGATNRPHVLDPALTRPGRLERVVELHPPGARERLDIFQNECQKLGVVSGIAWNYLVNRTRGLTVANLTTAINHSAIHSIRLNSLHTLESLEYGLDTMIRHKRAIKMMTVRPMPSASTFQSHDPYAFFRVAYYNAGKALLHAVLPDHPPLAFVKLAVEPFESEYKIRDLFFHNYTRTELEIRLIGLHAGKAAEYLMLYGTKPEGVLPSAIHLLESDQGADELAFASELAHAMVDEWFLYEHNRQPLKFAVRENDSERNLRRSAYTETREALQYWMDMSAKAFSHLPSDRDRPAMDLQSKSTLPGHTVYQRLEELGYWAARLSRIDLSAMTLDYIQWYQYYLRQPFRTMRSRFWVPADVYYHQEPATGIDSDALLAYIKEENVSWNTIGKDWDQQVREWDPTQTVLPGSQRPTVAFRDWHLIDRDYLMQSLMGVSFETALNLLQEFRPLLDTLANHLLNTRILRQDVLAKRIREYIDVRRQSGVPTPVNIMDFTHREVLPGLISTEPAALDSDAAAMGAGRTRLPLIAPIQYARPDSDFELSGTQQYLTYERAWGPQSRKPFGKKIPLWYFNNPSILRSPTSVPDFAAGIIDELQRSMGARSADEMRD